MTEQEVRELLEDSLCGYADIRFRYHSYHSFAEAGILTSNEGLVITMVDGSQFQLTIVKSK